nr:hypothetical protein [Tanacetum cinerariifolium]
MAALATYFLLRRCLKANKRTKVYYECMEPFKSLMCLWVRSRTVSTIWLEKVVTPLIDPTIKGFAAASAILKPERLKVDKHESPTSPTKSLLDVGSRRISICEYHKDITLMFWHNHEDNA